MSKLFKDLNYDTDRVMQPGDPITSYEFGGDVGSRIIAQDGSYPTVPKPIFQYSEHSYSHGYASPSYYYNNNWIAGFATFTPTGSGVTFAVRMYFDCKTADLVGGKGKYVYLELGTGSYDHKTDEFLDTSVLTTYPMTNTSSVVDGTTVYEYTVSGILLTDAAVSQYGQYLTNRVIKFTVRYYSGSPFPQLEGTFFGVTSDSAALHDVGLKRSIVSKELATVDQIPTNTHDADKVISPTGSTVVRSLDNGTATITHPGTSGSLGSPVVTFSSDFSFGTISNYAGTTISTEGPYTVAGWTVWIKRGDTVPTDVSGIMSKEFIIAAPNSTLCMFFNEGSDFANVQNIDTQNPTVNLYGGGATGSVTMVRNYADVTETLAVTTDLRYSISTPTQTTSGTTVSLTLNDRSINQVSLASTVTTATISFPAKVVGYARDFFVRLTITGTTVPAITWQEANGDPIDFDIDDESWADIEQGVNILMFTETNQAAS